MLRAVEAPHGGMEIMPVPQRRQRAGRRRLAAVAVVFAIASAGGLVGQLSSQQQDDGVHPAPPGPFTYLP